MYLDITSFGYGVGLVMAGWVLGMVASLVFGTVRGIARIV
jgi:hypothetical protein